MQKTSNVFARVEPELKLQAESILSQLGIPMSNAINIFLKQVVLQRGIPFDMKLPATTPIAVGSLDDDALDTDLEKGFADMKSGRVRLAKDVFVDMRRDYNL